jgi:hypothetical protein
MRFTMVFRNKEAPPPQPKPVAAPREAKAPAKPAVKDGGAKKKAVKKPPVKKTAPRKPAQKKATRKKKK